jgi:hypothetical protein
MTLSIAQALADNTEKLRRKRSMNLAILTENQNSIIATDSKTKRKSNLALSFFSLIFTLKF